jgi:hypothetical protein
MKKVFAQTTFAGILFLFGIGSIVVSFINTGKGGQMWLFICVALLCIGGGALFLRTAVRSKKLLLAKAAASTQTAQVVEPSPSASPKGFAAMLEKQNQLVNQWNKTESLQNELKVLQVSSEPTPE